MIIATHPGTGTDIVASTLRKRGARLCQITDRQTAHTQAFDGLILLGGCDISPTLYGQLRTYSSPPDLDRDKIEWVLVRRAMAENKPILGICRGHQMLAIAHGGSLHQDIHAETRKRHSGWHSIQPLRPLTKHIPHDDHFVNSLHHQAVICPPPGMQAVATSQDGILEAIWRPGALGVQWHPELLIANGQPEWASIFEWFLDGLR